MILMEPARILLLHGPINSNGINFLSSELFKTPSERANVRADFDASENIKALAFLFRRLDFKIIYSGWEEDESWLIENVNLFDSICISNQSELPSESNFLNEKIQNNKLKLYTGCLNGILHIESIFGSNCIVVRMRSDIGIDVELINREVKNNIQFPNSISLEYADPKNTYFVPDFIFISTLQIQKYIYGHLTTICKNGFAYHVSSHIDFGATLLRMRDEKLLDTILTMDHRLYDGMVWRGLPRYYAFPVNSSYKSLYFGCIIKYPEQISIKNLIDSISPELIGNFVS